MDVYERVGQYINVYDEEDGIHDIFILLHPLEDPVTEEMVEQVTAAVRKFFEMYEIKTEDVRKTINTLFPKWGVEVRGW